MAQDHYATLGLSRSASPEEIQKAYRKLARKYHPDKNPDDASAKKKFQQVQAAFDVLSDADKRNRYDQFGSDFDSVGAGGGPRGWRYTTTGGPQTFPFDLNEVFGAGAPDVEGGGFADLFKQFSRSRGGRPGGRPASRGGDLRHELTIPFATAVHGGEAALTVQRGSGKVESIRVKIPAGIDDGKKIRLRGQGEVAAATGAPTGDILLTIHVSPHPSFRRSGNRLDVRVPVTLAEGALGAKVDVPTPRGTITLTIPPNTSSGKRLRIKGHGVQPKGQPAGDLFAEIQIVIPPNMLPEERQTLADISNRYPQNPRADLRW